MTVISNYRTLFITAILLMLIPCITLLMWIANWSGSRPFEQVKTAYLQKFPAPFQNVLLLTLTDIILLGAAGYLFFQAKNDQRFKTPSWILFCTCGVLLCCQFFSLM